MEWQQHQQLEVLMDPAWQPEVELFNEQHSLQTDIGQENGMAQNVEPLNNEYNSYDEIIEFDEPEEMNNEINYFDYTDGFQPSVNFVTTPKTTTQRTRKQKTKNNKILSKRIKEHQTKAKLVEETNNFKEMLKNLQLKSKITKPAPETGSEPALMESPKTTFNNFFKRMPKKKRPHQMVMLSKTTRRTTVRPTKLKEATTEATGTLKSHVSKGDRQTGFHKFSKVLINDLTRIPATLLQGEERMKRKVMRKVGSFVSVLTDFATAYNKLSRALIEQR